MWVTSSEALLMAACLASACGAFSFGPELQHSALAGECSDGIDNDLDGLIDFPFDPGCESELDSREERLATPRACSDGVDNDGDGRIDFDGNHNGVRDGLDDP